MDAELEKNTNLVLISSSFPFGQAGDNSFIKNEIDTLSENFRKVTVISTTKECNITRKLPQNVEVKRKNIESFNLLAFIIGCFKLFSFTTFREIRYAKNKLGFSFNFGLLKSIFKYYYADKIIRRTIKLSIENENETILYSYWLSSRAFALANLKKKGCKCKAVSRAHGFDCYISRGYIPFRRELNRYLDEIYFISEDGLNDYKENLLPTFDKSNSSLLINRLGVKASKKCESEYITNLVNNTKEYNIISCSSIIDIKRLDIIIGALSLISDLKINWIHFGDGPLRAKIEKLAFEKLNKNLNIKYRFVGAIANEKLHEYYLSNKIELLINSSDSEGIPVSIMEAYQHGIPALGRDVGGIREIIHDKKCLLPPNAAEKEFSRAIFDFLSRNDEKKQIDRDYVQNIFNQYFDAEKQATLFVESLKETNRLKIYERKL